MNLVTRIALGVALVFYVVRELRLGVGYPVPWPDEGSFLWPALAFRDKWTLFAPEIDPTRHAMWMPPGFMVLQGLLFKVVPFSLGAARALSAVCVASAFACIAQIVGRSRAFPGHALVLGVFLTCPIFELVGNVARMEGLVLFLAAAGFLLLDRGRALGLAVLALAPLVHPNGVFPLAFGIFCFFVATPHKRPLERADRLVLVLVGISWIGYLAYVATHFAEFRIDIGNQIRFKQFVASEGGHFFSRLWRPVVWAPGLLLCAAGIAARRSGARVAALSCLSAALLLQTVLTAGWLYECYAAFAVLVAFMVVIETATSALQSSPWPERRRTAALAGTCVVAAIAATRVIRSPFILRSLENAVVPRSSRSPPYLTPDDVRALSEDLTSIASGSTPVNVRFIPDGEELVFERARSDTLRFVVPTFHQFRWDVVVLHDSVWLPKLVHDLQLVHALFSNKNPAAPSTTIVRSRDGTERWTVYRWPTAP